MISDKKLCQLCINSYKGKHGKIKSVKGVSNPIWYKKGHTEFYTCEDKDTFYVVFQGSNGSADWIDNLDFKQEKYGHKLKYHAGFLNQFLEIEPLLSLILTTNNKKIQFVGHSLGGALAIIAGQYFLDIDNKEVISFGSPKVGDKNFKKFYEYISPKVYRSKRYVLQNDIVTKVPFKWMLFWKYYHVGEKIQLGEKSGFKRFIKNPIKYIKGSKDDHKPENYLKALKNEKK